MSRLPAQHHALSHAALKERLFAAARGEFSGAPLGLWDPSRDDGALDLGRGLLDAFALGLHVLWTYQEAWAEEGFLATARLDESTDRLLGHLGYRSSPGTAAVGLQHFRCRAGMPAMLPIGVAIQSSARGEQQDAIYETLETAQINPDLNEVQAFLPVEPIEESTGFPDPPPTVASGSPAAPPPTAASGSPAAPPPTAASGSPVSPPAAAGSTSFAEDLASRIQDQRHGAEAARNVAQARQNVLRLSDMMNLVQKSGAKPCGDAIKAVCEALADAQRAATAKVPDSAKAKGALSQSQEILARQLKRIGDQQSTAMDHLETALARHPDEPTDDYSKRLDAMMGFLDAFVSGLIQDARDQIVLLHGIGALSRLDRAIGGGGTSTLGKAKAGCDTVYLLAPTTTRPLPAVRTGDWFVIAEDIESIDARGNTSRERFYREAVRVLRASAATPPPPGAPLGRPLTRITFTPSLQQGYDLDRVVFLGNIASVSEGSTIEEAAQPSADRRTIALSRGPLTWLRDSLVPSGRRPAVELFVGGRRWERVDNLLGVAGTAAVYAVEPAPGGGVVLRVGDGVLGAALPADLPIRVRYRIGLGVGGNRESLRLTNLVGAHPAVEETFNPLPTDGGTDPEPRMFSRIRGPAVTSAMDRAVSLDDVRALARAFDGVLRARVFREGTARRCRLTVVVAGPAGAALGSQDLQDLESHLAARIPPGVTVYVENRLFVPVYARILLRVARGADPLKVIQRVRLRLGVDRAPGEPVGLLDPDNVDIDDDLKLSRMYGALEGVLGLSSVVIKALHREGQVGLFDRVEAAPRELLGWAHPGQGPEGLELPFEEARDL